jgi:hypothetical protein
MNIHWCQYPLTLFASLFGVRLLLLALVATAYCKAFPGISRQTLHGTVVCLYCNASAEIEAQVGPLHKCMFRMEVAVKEHSATASALNRQISDRSLATTAMRNSGFNSRHPTAFMSSEFSKVSHPSQYSPGMPACKPSSWNHHRAASRDHSRACATELADLDP